MKKFRKLSLIILSFLCCSLFAFGLFACGNDDSSKTQDKDILAVYNLYVAYAEENNINPLSYEDWLLSIKGDKGDTGVDGTNGIDGKSAYQIWLDNGNTGSEIDFLNWLKGKDGINGTDGVDGTNGVDGKSAYQIWLDNGNTGSETDFLNWLKGKDGTNGVNGLGIKNVEINDNGDLIVTFDDDTFMNAGNVVNPNIKLNENNKIAFNTLTVTGNNVYGKVSNTTEIYSFINEIELIGNAGYTVYTDLLGKNSIPTKTVTLEVGDNKFYILETCGNDSNLYTVTIRRKPLYTVSYITNNENVAVDAQTVEEDAFAINPGVFQYNGYGTTWDYDFNKPISKDITVTATWNAVYVYKEVSKQLGFTSTTAICLTGITDFGKSLSTIVIPKYMDSLEILNTEIIDCKSIFDGCQFEKIIVESVCDDALQAWLFVSTTVNQIILPDTITYISHHCFGPNQNIIFKGVLKQWSSINKEDMWACGENIKVICTDGEIICE